VRPIGGETRPRLRNRPQYRSRKYHKIALATTARVATGQSSGRGARARSQLRARKAGIQDCPHRRQRRDRGRRRHVHRRLQRPAPEGQTVRLDQTRQHPLRAAAPASGRVRFRVCSGYPPP
jgi:hypothetical protein